MDTILQRKYDDLSEQGADSIIIDPHYEERSHDDNEKTIKRTIDANTMKSFAEKLRKQGVDVQIEEGIPVTKQTTDVQETVWLLIKKVA